MEKYWVLSNINLYRILCPPKLKSYNKRLGKPYEKEAPIYLEDNVDENIYLVSSGKVKLVNYDQSGKEIVRQIITKGGLFGENVLLGEPRRQEFAISCENNTSVCSMNLDTMQELMRNNNRFSTAIYKLIGLKIKKIERRIELLVGKNVTSRVASYIYDCHKEQDSLKIQNELSQKNIASLLATSRESVAKVFSKLKEEGIIDYTRKSIIIKNVDKLKNRGRLEKDIIVGFLKRFLEKCELGHKY